MKAVSSKQRLVIVFALCVIALMLIFPPAYGRGYGGYSVFFFAREIKVHTLMLQIGIVAALALAALVFFGKR